MADSEHLAALAQGARAFNQWRQRNPGLTPDFSGASLGGARLDQVNLRGAVLSGADLRGADLRSANLEQANVTGVKYLRDCRQQAFFGLRLSTCHGSQMFKSFAEDQILLEEYRQAHPVWFWLWWATSDCGHSLPRWAGISLCIAVLYALAYYLMGPVHFHSEHLPYTPTSMLYFSYVTFTTLGFGDINPMTEAGAMVVMSEVILGYTLLGGLISILAIKLSRRG